MASQSLASSSPRHRSTGLSEDTSANYTPAAPALPDQSTLAMSGSIPPPPPGYTLNPSQQQGGNIPPPPPGYTLNPPDQSGGSRAQTQARSIDPLRQIALISRAAAEGVVNTLAIPIDMKEQLFGPIRNAIANKLGLPAMPDTTVSGLLKRGLDAAGAYNPETSGEQMGSAVTRGITGALTGGGIANSAPLAASQIPNLIRTAASGATGAGSSELARQYGYSPGVQMLAGVVGGLAPAAIEESARGVGRIVSNVAAPFTRSGQQRIAGNVLANQATDPAQAAQNLDAAQSVLPGSMRTSGEASQDLGLMSLEKEVRARDPVPFSQRMSEQNTARQDALAKLAGTRSDIQSMQQARAAQTGPMRETALASSQPAVAQPVLDHIDSVLASPIGKRDIPSAALNWVRGKIEGETDPASLYAVRQDIGDALAGKLTGDASKFRLARKELMDVRASLDNAIESAAPGFKAYLQRYSEMSQPIDQAKVLQEIQRRAQLTATDVTSGQQFMGTANFSRALDAALRKEGNRLAPDQVRQLEAIRTDLQYGQALNSPNVKAPTPETFRNLSIAQALGAGGGTVHPAFMVLTKPVQWVYKIAGSDEAINDNLTRAMLDPKLAAMMLRQATPQRMAQFSERLKAAGIGTTAGIAAQQSATR